MSTLNDAVQAFLAALAPIGQIENPSQWLKALEDAHARGRAVSAAASGASLDALIAAAERLIPALRLSDPQAGGEVALTLGVLIEKGVPPKTVARPLLEAFRDTLMLLEAFITTVIAEVPEPPDDLEEAPASYWVRDRYVAPERAQELWRRDRRLPQAHAGVELWCLPVVALLSRDRDVLKEAQGDAALLHLVDTLSDGRLRFVRMLLRLLQDEMLLVLHPEAMQGFRVRIEGVTDNFQLHTLLADALIRENRSFWRRLRDLTKKERSSWPRLADVLNERSIWRHLWADAHKERGAFQRHQGRAWWRGPIWGIAGTRPWPDVIAVMRGDGPASIKELWQGTWNLYQWTAIDDAGQLPDKVDSRHWIWNEGIPAEIASVDGVRVILLGAPTVKRIRRATRSLPHLAATLDVEEVLEVDEVRRLLAQLGARQAGVPG
jgi:hypothetical protein